MMSFSMHNNHASEEYKYIGGMIFYYNKGEYEPTDLDPKLFGYEEANILPEPPSNDVSDIIEDYKSQIEDYIVVNGMILYKNKGEYEPTDLDPKLFGYEETNILPEPPSNILDKWKIINIKKDGNCLFNSIAHQMKTYLNSNYTGDDLIKFSTSWLRNNKDLKLKDNSFLSNKCDTFPIHNDNEISWIDYISRMEENGIYGELVIVYAISILFNISITIKSYENKDLAIINEGLYTLCNINILFGSKHYDVITHK
jgi:hypothetical protein